MMLILLISTKHKVQIGSSFVEKTAVNLSIGQIEVLTLCRC